MNTLDAIRSRKSVRSYNNKPVEQDKIKAIVNAGYMAAGTPLAGKRYFNVITSPELLKKISEATKNVMLKSGNDFMMRTAANPAYDPLNHAPVAVIISTAKNDPANDAMLAANTACAGENMLIAAEDLGLRSCYTVSPTFAFSDPSIAEACKLPEGTKARAVILFGYSDDAAPHAERPADPKEIIYV